MGEGGKKRGSEDRETVAWVERPMTPKPHQEDERIAGLRVQRLKPINYVSITTHTQSSSVHFQGWVMSCHDTRTLPLWSLFQAVECGWEAKEMW